MAQCSRFDFQTGTCTQVDIGFDFSKVLTYTDVNGDAINVTGFVFSMTIKDELSGATLLTLPIVGDNLTTGLYIPSPISGIINMQITDTDAGLIAAGVYPYEMTVTDNNSKVDIFMQGSINFINRGF